jgi:hypothetical protein
MELKDRLYLGNALIEILKEHTDRLDDPFDEDLPDYIRRAIMVKMRMRGFYTQYGEPPEMLEQLETIENIIKSMMELQNKRRY